MKAKTVHILTRIMAGALSVSLILPMSGCTDNGQNEPPAAEAEASPTQAPVEAEPTPEPAPSKIDDNGKPIADFDEFVNGEWLKEQEANGSGSLRTTSETEELIQERVRDILENTDISERPEDDSLVKIISLYREAIRTDDIDERVKTIREYLKPIANAKSLDDIYDLYAQERYGVFNYIVRFSIKNDENGYNTPIYKPFSYMEQITRMQELLEGDEDPEKKEIILAYWKELGYSEDRLVQITDNAKKVSEFIEKFYSLEDEPLEEEGSSFQWYYWDQDDLEKAGLNVPVIDILRELNALARYEDIYAPDAMIGLLNTLYTKENTEMLRDHYLFCAAMDLYDDFAAYPSLYEDAGWDREEYKASVRLLLSSMAGDILAEEYRNRYLEEGMYENAEILADEIKNELMAILGEADWMGENSRRSLKAKIARMTYFLGSNGHVNDYQGFYPGGNYIEDCIDLITLNRSFAYSQTKYEDDKRQPFGVDMLTVNGRYFPKSNMFVLSTGALVDPACRKDAPYEEQLAHIVKIMAHEMSHTLTPDAVYYDEQGYYNMQLSTEEEDELWNRAQAIADFFDNVEIADGKYLTGWDVENETFADLLGMKVCLNLLAKSEDPDYDLFFRCWAENMAHYVAESDIDRALEDEHLTGKLRINYILAQFDIFYEIYDIDESSTYYVPADKRLKTY